ncbi:phosphotransferase [bacterium]|nr:phosphotransferase [candidate division CSSED10-310 bacterium]
MGIWRLNRTYRNFQRMQTILNVLMKHGFGHLVRRLGLHRFLPLGKQASTLRPDDPGVFTNTTLARRIRAVLEELGPTFIKFGQVLSSRPDLIPLEIVEELKHLRENVAPIPFHVIKQQIVHELKCSFEETFTTFNETPIGAASIAQVHSAVLKSGEEVIVKVMRPNIERTVRNDLCILEDLAGLLVKHFSDLEQFDPKGLVHQFEKTILSEMDFTIEAINTEHVRNNFEDDPEVVIPRIFWDLTRKRIITQEYIHGIAIDRIEEIREIGLDPSQIARKGMRIFLREILEHGFFHADPHPGNILVLKDGRIALLDFGMVGRLDPNSEESVSELIIGIMDHDYKKMIRSLRDLDFTFREEDIRAVRLELRTLVETYYGLPLGRIGLSEIFCKLIYVIRQYKVKVPTDFLMLSRAVVVAEGIGRQLDPTIDVFEIGKPIIKEILRHRSDPRKLAKDGLVLLWDLKRLTRDFPNQLNGILKKILTGKLRFEFSHENLQTLYREMEKVGNRIAGGLIIASLVIGSAIIITKSDGPLIFGYSALGTAGLFIAGFAIVLFVISIFRSNRF